MSYRIVTTSSAEKDLLDLPKSIIPTINSGIQKLANNPRPRGCKKLKGAKEDLWRIRVGDYRIIYLIADKIEIIEIRRVRHRKDVYRL